MNFDINTLAFISGFTFLTQITALYVQYIVNRSYRGVFWWLLGSTFWAVGVIFMPLVAVKQFELLARIANPLVILGQIYIYIGIMRFLQKKENKWVLGIIFSVFLIFYYYFMFVFNEISLRTMAISIASCILSFMSAYQIFFKKDKLISVSANFTAFLFFIYGCFAILRIYNVLANPLIRTYYDQWTILQLTFIVPIVICLLWTFGFIIMVNQRLIAENREEKEKLLLIFNTSPDAALISRLMDGKIVDANTGFFQMSGYSSSELIDNTTLEINIWKNLEDRDLFMGVLRDKGICENLEFEFKRKNGSLLTGRISAKVINIQQIPHIFSVVHDITKSKQDEETLRESEELYRSILNASPDDITITDLQGCIQVVSPAAKKMFGYAPEFEDFVGSQLVDYILPEDRDRAKLNIIKMQKGEQTGPNEYKGIRKDKSIIDIEVNSGIIYGASCQPSRMVFIVRDISERKQTEIKIQQLVKQLEIEKKAAQRNANTDSMTGLANRRYFDEVLSLEFRRSKRSGLPISLIMLDVDYFKKFNDFYGHIAGDECLRQIGNVLKTVVGRATDIVARYGGEEFVVILTDTDEVGAVTLAERIRKAVADLSIPHSDSDIFEYVTVSLGVVTAHTTKSTLLAQIVMLADEAMYRAKKSGRNQVSVINENTILENNFIN
jgi:diguanylate cyclase (GGDEF)-like protein/PAS domain S-box-containing protein